MSLTNVKSGEIHTSVAAEETVDSSNGQTHHIMIIQEEPPTQVIANDVSILYLMNRLSGHVVTCFA